MKFMCLVYGEATMFREMTADQLKQLDADSLAYDGSLQERGKLVMAEALQSTTTAKTVRKRKGKVLVSDGPFAETKEQLLGFVLVEAADQEEALAIAADIPLAAMGSVEVRGLYDVPGS